MKQIFFILVLILCYSCKNEDKVIDETQSTDNTEKKIEEKKVSKFTFEIDLETSLPDDFSLFTNELFLNNNQFMDIVIVNKLNANETSKTIIFELPEGLFPDYNLGFSLGRKNVKEVKVNYIKISYGGSTFDIKSSEVSDYFNPNRFVEINKETGVIKTKKIDGKHNPRMTFKRKFLDTMTN
jgi:hypothetical protein